jgi:predicted secreted protein
VANDKGLACLLKVGATATAPSTYATLEGQTDTNFDGTVSTADATDKDSGAWETGLATTRSGVVTTSGNLKTPRTNMNLLEAAWVGGTTHNCQIVFDVAGKGYKGDFYVTTFNVSGAHKDVGKYSITLTPAGALVAIP